MKLLQLIVLIGCLSVAMFAQQPVTLSDAFIPDYTSLFYTPSSSVTYACYAKTSSAPTSTITVSGVSNANPGVVTATGHGLHVDMNPEITISGGTGGWAAVNGTHRATIINANSFSIPVNTSSLGAVTGTLVFTTKAPRTNQKIWLVMKVMKDASGNVSSRLWATGGYSNACDDRATLVSPR
jgi:hypothetical protein